MRKIKDRTGETRVMRNGLKATIVEYRMAKSMDVKFENDQIVHNVRYEHFEKGKLNCPMIIKRIGNYAKVTNVNVTPAFEFLIDTEDIEIIKNKNWCATNSGYVHNNPLGLLHRIITNAPDDMFVDHRDANGLDNRRSNLRICTKSENHKNQRIGKRNVSGYKGVSWDKRNNKWIAQIANEGKGYYLGAFDEKALAAKAYDEAAIKLHGEFALINNV